MLQDLLTHLPTEAGPKATVAAVSVAALGFSFWLAGARFSRSIFTLVGVAAGAWFGLRIPRWMGWEIDAMAIAIGGALVLGFAGYLLHTVWVGFTLGALLATAAFIATWQKIGGAELSLPMMDPTMTVPEIARQLWGVVPGGTARTLAVSTGIAFIAGGLVTAFWPKLGRVLTFSALGSLLLAGGATVAAQLARPAWIELIPKSLQIQVIAFAGLVALGAAIQWLTAPRVATPGLSRGAAGDSELGTRGARKPRDLRDLGTSKLGPMRIKEARA